MDSIVAFRSDTIMLDLGKNVGNKLLEKKRIKLTFLFSFEKKSFTTCSPNRRVNVYYSRPPSLLFHGDWTRLIYVATLLAIIIWQGKKKKKVH